ncbi:hypothetical protein ABIE52_001336 [Rhodococcus sp. OAS809]|uniref:GmrSD restriction endonuclease domain-containing protein n=1 Tax=Rhodococcus sp. OAS809 TaxID=2663874 RepID=UPI00178BADE5
MPKPVLDGEDTQNEDFVEELPDEITEDPEADAKLTAEDVQDVLLYTLDWSVQSLLEKIGQSFDINPAFQRRDAWSRDRKSRYIESLMLGLPVPQVVLAEDKNSKRFIVLDGKQRLMTMKQFGAPEGQFSAFKLTKLEFLEQLNGKGLDQIKKSGETAEWVESFLSQPVRTIVVRNWGKTEVLYEIFRRLNQGSLPLSPQELRQALYPGEFSTWINETSANSSAIRRARRLKREDFRMRDAELLLRSVSFQDDIENYDGDLREFLDNMCKRGNAGWKDEQERYEGYAAAIEKAIERTELVFQDGNTFMRYVGGDEPAYVRRFNVAVFDTMSMVFSAAELSDSSIRANADGLRTRFEDLCIEDSEFEAALKSTTKTARATAKRVIAYGGAVEEELGIKLGVVERAKRLMASVHK